MLNARPRATPLEEAAAAPHMAHWASAADGRASRAPMTKAGANRNRARAERRII